MKKLFAWMAKLRAGPAGSRVASQRGRAGEARAAAFLKKEKGMRVLARNWRQGRDEVDLVCEDRGVLVFVEVKGPGDSIRDAQRWWAGRLRRCGIVSEVWRVKPA